jgi:predicted DCC family thiol-disulfide oxidoreductase YuxK
VGAIVIYDNDCGFCRWSLALLLDRDRDALRPLPLGTAEADYLLHDLPIEEREASWHLVIDPPPAGEFEQLRLGLPGAARDAAESSPARFSAGAALPPALRLLPRGRRLAWFAARVPGPTERGYRWVAEHRGLLGRLVTRRARRWADRVIAEHGGPTRG